MDNDKWFEQFDFTKDKIETLFTSYEFTQEWNTIQNLRKWRRRMAIMVILNDVWFKMPDEVNIRNNTPGWQELLNLIEE